MVQRPPQQQQQAAASNSIQPTAATLTKHLSGVPIQNMLPCSSRMAAAAVSPSASSDDDWDSDGSTAEEAAAADCSRGGGVVDAARNLLVFAADKAGMQVAPACTRHCA